MFRTFNLVTQVPPDHELRIKLPADVPVGPADIAMVVSTRKRPAPKGVRPSIRKAFGMWKDRITPGASGDFARQLRRLAWSRPAA